jgi:hypothetical protein
VIPASSKYYPRNLAVASAPGESVYEFLVVWNHELPSLPNILGVFSKHKAKVILAHSQVDVSTDTVVGTFFCSLAQADQNADDIRKEILGLGFVRSVEAANTEHSLFDKFLFPVTVWGRERVLIIRQTPLLNIENRLVKELGSAGSAIMFREGEDYAAETLGQYRKVLGSVTQESLLENVKDGLRATGWGIFDFKTTKEGYEVTVHDAAMLETMTEPSRFLCGIIAGIVESIYAIRVRVVQSTVNPKSGLVFVRLSNVVDNSARQ